MDEETEPDSDGSAYVATRCLLQATVITALRHNQPLILFDCQYQLHSQCLSAIQLLNISNCVCFTGEK